MKRNEEWDISRRKIISNAIDACLREMYQKAQPPADIDEYVKKVESGEINDNTRPYIYQRHYLSNKEAKYIADKYLSAYRMNDEWTSNIDLLLSDLKEGCTINKTIPEYTDENGITHPSYRGYDNKAPLNDCLNDILKKHDINDDNLAKALTNEVMLYIKERQEFYRFDNEHTQFTWAVMLGSCPTSNKKDVEEYWESQGKPVNIIEHNPDAFWYVDAGYSDEEIKELLEDEENEEAVAENV